MNVDATSPKRVSPQTEATDWSSLQRLFVQGPSRPTSSLSQQQALSSGKLSTPPFFSRVPSASHSFGEGGISKSLVMTQAATHPLVGTTSPYSIDLVALSSKSLLRSSSVMKGPTARPTEDDDDAEVAVAQPRARSALDVSHFEQQVENLKAEVSSRKANISLMEEALRAVKSTSDIPARTVCSPSTRLYQPPPARECRQTHRVYAGIVDDARPCASPDEYLHADLGSNNIAPRKRCVSGCSERLYKSDSLRPFSPPPPMDRTVRVNKLDGPTTERAEFTEATSERLAVADVTLRRKKKREALRDAIKAAGRNCIWIPEMYVAEAFDRQFASVKNYRTKRTQADDAVLRKIDAMVNGGRASTIAPEAIQASALRLSEVSEATIARLDHQAEVYAQSYVPIGTARCRVKLSDNEMKILFGNMTKGGYSWRKAS